jgi:hypothetical protein
VIDPEVNGAAAGKQSKEFLSAFSRENVSGQIPEPAYRTEYVVRQKGLWGPVPRFDIRHIKDIEPLVRFSYNLVPHSV